MKRYEFPYRFLRLQLKRWIKKAIGDQTRLLPWAVNLRHLYRVCLELMCSVECFPVERGDLWKLPPTSVQGKPPQEQIGFHEEKGTVGCNSLDFFRSNAVWQKHLRYGHFSSYMMTNAALLFTMHLSLLVLTEVTGNLFTNVYKECYMQSHVVTFTLYISGCVGLTTAKAIQKLTFSLKWRWICGLHLT